MARGRPLVFWRRLAGARVFLLPAVLLLAVTLPHLEQGDFRGDAGWYAALGLQAWRTGELWTLYADPGQHYFNKPPLAFWIHGLFLHVLGPSVWAARLPTVLAALGCVFATVGVARELAGRRPAIFSGIVLALTIDFFRRTREISLDMWQTLFLLLAVWCVARGVARAGGAAQASIPDAGPQAPASLWIALSGIPVGLALLTKPLVALLFFPIMAVWLAWIRRPRAIAPLAAGAVLALLVAAPWHLSMAKLHGEAFTGHYFGAEIAQRAAGDVLAGHAKRPPPWFYAQQLAATYWPWLIAVVLALVTLLRGGSIARDTRGPRLALLWVGAWLLMLSLFPDRRDRYALVLFPGLAWIAGMWLATAPLPKRRDVQRLLFRYAGPLAAIIALILAIAPIQLQRGRDRHWQELFAWVRANTTAGESPRVWQGGLESFVGARFYMEFGEWPETTRDRWGNFVASPPEGALILYHERGGLRPGLNEAQLFQSHNGHLTVYRLGPGGWQATPIADPGEN